MRTTASGPGLELSDILEDRTNSYSERNRQKISKETILSFHKIKEFDVLQDFTVSNGCSLKKNPSQQLTHMFDFLALAMCVTAAG